MGWYTCSQHGTNNSIVPVPHYGRIRTLKVFFYIGTSTSEKRANAPRYLQINLLTSHSLSLLINNGPSTIIYFGNGPFATLNSSVLNYCHQVQSGRKWKGKCLSCFLRSAKGQPTRQKGLPSQGNP